MNCEQSDKHERDVEAYDFEDTPEWDFYGRIGEGGCLDGMFGQNMGYCVFLVFLWDVHIFFINFSGENMFVCFKKSF